MEKLHEGDLFFPIRQMPIMLAVMKIALIAAMVLSMLPGKGFTEPVPDASLPFCRGSYQMACPGDDAAKMREQKIDRIEKTLKTEAFQKTLDELDDEDLKATLKEFEDIDTIRPKRVRLGVEKIFYAKLRLAFAHYITENNLPINWGDELVSEALHIAIEEADEITPIIKERMHNILNETRFIAFQNNVSDNTLEDIHALYKLCSKSFEDNAFATTIHKERVVVLCPGEMIGAIEFGNDMNFMPNLKLMPLVMTMGHELAHHFDYRHYPSAYKQIYEEMSQRQSEFKRPIEKYMSEISADTWGLKVTKIIMSKIGSPATQSNMYAGALNDLCGSEDDGIHPSGKFRIQVLATEYLCH